MSNTGPEIATLSATRRGSAHGHPGSGVVLGLATAVVCAIGVWLTWRVFVDTAAGQRVDQAVYAGAHFGRNRLWHVAYPVLDLVSVPYIAGVLGAAVLIAVLRRRWAMAVQVALLVGGANLTTRVLKTIVFSRPNLHATPLFSNALPSGHTTAAASVSAALVFVVPPRARPWAAAFGALYTAATGVSTLVGGWHRPSDAVAGMLVVLAWSGLACALADWSQSGAGSTPARRRRLPALGSGGGLLVLAGLGTALPAAYSLRASWMTVGALNSRAELLVAYAGGAFGVIAASALAFAVLLFVRQSADRAV